MKLLTLIGEQKIFMMYLYYPSYCVVRTQLPNHHDSRDYTWCMYSTEIALHLPHPNSRLFPNWKSQQFSYKNLVSNPYYSVTVCLPACYSRYSLTYTERSTSHRRYLVGKDQPELSMRGCCKKLLSILIMKRSVCVHSSCITRTDNA